MWLAFVPASATILDARGIFGSINLCCHVKRSSADGLSISEVHGAERRGQGYQERSRALKIQKLRGAQG